MTASHPGSCPHCGARGTVIHTRAEANHIRRRRKCLSDPAHRWTSREETIVLSPGRERMAQSNIRKWQQKALRA